MSLTKCENGFLSALTHEPANGSDANPFQPIQERLVSSLLMNIDFLPTPLVIK